MPDDGERSVAVDTSVAVPLVVRSHAAHAEVVRWRDGRGLALSGHAAAETYSVLTRLPGDLRLTPADAATLMSRRFTSPLLLGSTPTARLPDVLAELEISGGAVYDALVDPADGRTDRDARFWCGACGWPWSVSDDSVGPRARASPPRVSGRRPQP